MKKVNSALILSGAQLVALSIETNAHATTLKPHFKESNTVGRIQQMSAYDMRRLEASHLEVYAGCKWGKPAFDPIEVGHEIFEEEVLALFKNMDRVS